MNYGDILWKTIQIYGRFELFRAGGSTWNYGGILFRLGLTRAATTAPEEKSLPKRDLLTLRWQKTHEPVD